MDDANTDVISQRSITGGPVFHFNESYLKYFGVEWEFNAKYEEIAGPSQYRRSRSHDRLGVFISLFMIVLCWIVLSRSQELHFEADGLRWFIRTFGEFVAVPIAICIWAYFVSRKEYTVVPAKNGNVLIAKDKKHDAIIERLQAERLKRLRSLSEPDPANSPQEELAKLKWLHDEGAISESEYTYRCSQVPA